MQVEIEAQLAGAQIVLEEAGITLEELNAALEEGTRQFKQMEGQTDGQADDTQGVGRTPRGGEVFRGRSTAVIAEYGSEDRPISEIQDPQLFKEIISEVKAELGPLGEP